MSLKKGDFIIIDYIAKVKETGEIFDTTIEETSKKEHLFKEGDIVEPKLVVIGEGWVLKALDENLTTLEIGKPSAVEIPPDKAFGQRDPEKMKRVALRQLLSKDISPSIGARIEYGGKNATVRSIGAGRVLLDYNPPLAGKTLVYDVTVKKKLDTEEEKIASLIHRRVPSVDATKFEFAKKTNIVNVEMPEEAFYVEGIQVAKRGIALDITRFLPKMTAVKFIETYKGEAKKAETPAETVPKTGTEKTGKEEKPTNEPSAVPKP
jgi:peptidylprolyl isomerase